MQPILCRVGLHRWSDFFNDATCIGRWSRACERCKKLEVYQVKPWKGAKSFVPR